MPNVRYNNWARIEGCTITDLFKQYGTLNGIPNDEQYIYYGHPEIQLENPYSTTHSTVYAVKNIKDYFGYTQIHEIDENWNQFTANIASFIDNNPINISDSDTAYYYVGKPFVVSESCVIFYDDSTKSSKTGSKYSNYVIVLIDENAVANIVSITAEYTGDSVPIGNPIDPNLVTVTAIYDDENEIKITSGFTIEPADLIITSLGLNTFQVFYIDPEGDVNTTKFTVEGIKNLVGITGEWDGGAVPFTKEAQKKFFVITAAFSDGTSATVTNFSFPEGNIVTQANNGLIKVFYNGFTCDVQVETFQITSSRLIAFYNGPSVEIGHDYQKKYIDVRVYYYSETDIGNSYYETITVDECTINSTTVETEGANSFNISYVGLLGEITTSFIVEGFSPDVKPTSIHAEWMGPSLYVNDIIDVEKILCNIYYSDGTIKTKKNFSLDLNVIIKVGINDIVVTYVEGETTLEDIISINGLALDDTTKNNLFATKLLNNYPNATFLNNRYRGPAEGIKTDTYSKMITKNLRDLYKLFLKLEKQYNSIIEDIEDDNSIKILTLNNSTYMKYEMNQLLDSDHYTTGKYVFKEMS